MSYRITPMKAIHMNECLSRLSHMKPSFANNIIQIYDNTIKVVKFLVIFQIKL